MHRSLLLAAAASGVSVLLCRGAAAAEPKFVYAAPPETAADEVEWNASAQAGLILTTGNSRTTTVSGGAKAARKAGKNKIEFEGSGAFARSTLLLGNDVDGSGTLTEGEIERLSQTTTRMWMLRGRYDRFLAHRDALYLMAIASADKPAGKKFVGGAQAGYSRTLVKTEVHSLVAEAGYDFSYEAFVANDDALAIHSARVFTGYQGKLSEEASLNASAEALANLNKLDTPTGPAARLEDTRFAGKLDLTTTVHEDIKFRFGFTAKYDHVPAPRPPFALPFAEGFRPAADQLDTITEATLIINFL